MTELSADCVITENEHGGVLLDKSTGEYYSLNPIALRVLGEFTNGASLETVADGIAQDFEQPIGPVASDVNQIVRQFMDLGILVEKS